LSFICVTYKWHGMGCQQLCKHASTIRADIQAMPTCEALDQGRHQASLN
jgi:hypothetical protein